ncbi:class I SAM-dependent methyltransferase [Clostridium sp. C2-6-12]|uniref:class I SAM-dependent methyltransferase n=1 Tax=Clostridium sp. C2-6-12 TaxID=2698832 RepID=UPI0013697E89|nr:class I SAM-dependent methyltransferase [Clostridium sp. C2-6-12]
MNNDFKIYAENIEKPWNVMYYRIVWEQLPQMTNSKILDFGSGLGITANYLSKDNNVVAIEPDMNMVEMRKSENNYNQIIGGIERLKEQEDDSFDAVICHNVFEYAKEREDLFREFYRVLKPNGIISIVKHNHAGRIMAKAIFENNLDEVMRLLNDEVCSAAYFGEINYYTVDHIKEWIGELNINIEKVLGVRTLFGLHPNNEIRYDQIWQEKMFEIEMKVSDIEEYRNISFYHHVLLRKNKV